MEKTLTVRIPQIVWEDFPRPNEDVKVGDVFDSLVIETQARATP